MKRARLIRTAVFAVVAAGGLVLLDYLAPLQGPTVSIYFGIAILALGLIGSVAPTRWTALGSRKQAIGVIGLGAGLFAAGLYWPASAIATAKPVSRLDTFLPEYQFHEFHEMRIQAPPDRVLAALHQISFEDIGVMKTLGSIRNAAMGVRVRQSKPAPSVRVSAVDLMATGRTGFFPLDLGERELVFGMAGQPWNNRAVRLTPQEFHNWTPPGNVKIAFNFAVEDVGAGWSRISTETRVQATDDAARRTMAKYWRLIYPGSGMIRRSMLDAIRERATASRG